MKISVVTHSSCHFLAQYPKKYRDSSSGGNFSTPPLILVPLVIYFNMGSLTLLYLILYLLFLHAVNCTK